MTTHAPLPASRPTAIPTAIPIDAIDADALPRDRTHLDPGPLQELQDSLMKHGLRTPIEVFHDPEAGGYGLISGYRRLTAWRALHALIGGDAYATIPAVIRAPETVPDALREMVEENDIRADVSPWDQARIAVEAADTHFDTVDAAITALYGSASRQRRARIRAMADVVMAYEGLLIDPHTLTENKLRRLAAATRAGFEEVVEVALNESKAASAATQWQAIDPVLREMEAEAAGKLRRDRRAPPPRRTVRIRDTLRIRREMAPEGWTLRFTGRDATGALMEDIMDEVERLFGR